MQLKSLRELWGKASNTESRRLIVRSVTRRYHLRDYASAVPLLNDAFREDAALAVRIAAAEGLALADPLHAKNYVDFLRSVLRDNAAHRELLDSINALGHLGPPATESVPELLQCLRRSKNDVSIAALQALRLIQPNSTWAPELLNSLSDELFLSLDTWDWQWHRGHASRLVVNTLIEMGPEVMPILQTYQESPQRLQKMIAATAITEIGRHAMSDAERTAGIRSENLIPDVPMARHSPDRIDDKQILELIERCRTSKVIDGADHKALRALGSRAVSALPSIITQLKQTGLTDHFAREQLVLTIAMIGPNEAICRELLKHEDSRLRELTLTGLCTSDIQPPDLPELLQICLQDEDNFVRLTAAQLLWKTTGQALPAAMVILKELPSLPVITVFDHEILDGPPLNSWHQEWQWMIEPVLQMADSEPRIVEAVSAAWQAEPESINLARLYWKLTQCHDEVISQCIVKWLDRNELRELVASLELLQGMGARALPAMPALCRLLEVDFWLYQLYALEVIAKIGPAAVGVAANVLRTLKVRTPEADSESVFELAVVQAAAETLGKIYPDLPNLKAMLLRVVDNWHVRDLVALTPFEPDNVGDPEQMLSLLTKRLTR